MKPQLFVLSISISFSFSLAYADGDVSAPAGNKMFAEFAADGVQIYHCESNEKGFAWTFKAPEAKLMDQKGKVVGTHFAGPTWKLGDAGSVVGELVAKKDAPEKGAVPWLLLRAKTATGSLAQTSYVRRIDTKNGVVPMGGCDGAHVGNDARVPYSAKYQFYSKP